MKIIFTILTTLTLIGSAIAGSPPASYSTSRSSGTIMISGSGTYTSDLNLELKSSAWNLGLDAALFLFPQFAAGLEFGYTKDYQQISDDGTLDPIDHEVIEKYLGPRVYIFLGGKNSELTPFIKAGANYQTNKTLENGEAVELDATSTKNNYDELGLTASAGVLLNLAKNVGLSVEAEYNFARGTAVEDIDTKQLLIKFGIRSFLGN